MTPDRWRRIEELLESCLGQPPGQRISFLHQVCGEDAGLRAEVESLLGAHQDTRELGPGPRAVRPLLDALETEYYVGRMIGAYRLEEFIGRGAVGSVYRASESSTGQCVAVKILAPELVASDDAQSELRRRFDPIVRLRHPNIAAMYAVETGEGQDAIVMEYVAGRTLSEAETGLSLWARFRIARQLRNAIAAAHQAGIVHGDLRPSNVMVAADGRVKLIDFSIVETACEQHQDWDEYRNIVRRLFAAPARRAAWAVGLGAVAALTFWQTARTKIDEEPIAQITHLSGLATDPAVSPDGQRIAFASDHGGNGGLDIWIQPFSSRTHPEDRQRITSHESDDREPEFSPDGRWIAFRSERDGGGVYRIPSGGGSEELLAPQGRRPRYSPDGRWLAYFTGQESPRYPNRLFVLPAGGGTPKPIAPELESSHSQVWSPDSTRLLFLGRRPGERRQSWWLAAVDGGSLVRVDADRLDLHGSTLAFFRLLPNDWTPSDKVLFTLHTGSFTTLAEASLRGSTLQGPPRAIASSGQLNVSAASAPNGSVAYATVRRTSNLWLQTLSAQGSPVGSVSPLTLTTSAMADPSFDNAGRLLMTYLTPEKTDVLVRDLLSGADTPVLTGLPPSSWAKIVDNGSRVIYYEGGAVYIRPMIGGKPEAIAASDDPPWDVSSDGQIVLVSSGQNPDTVLTVRDGKPAVLLKHETLSVADARLAPGNTAVSFTAGGRIYVAPFPSGAPWTLASETPGHHAEWSPDGRSLYFVSSADGFPCLWRQRWDPVRRIPLGPAKPLSHFHRYALALGDAPLRRRWLAVGDGRIALVLTRTSGDLFLTREN